MNEIIHNNLNFSIVLKLFYYQPKEAEPDVNSTGAGGMVSPDSSGYPNKK
jgi:hypothetical protein